MYNVRFLLMPNIQWWYNSILSLLNVRPWLSQLIPYQGSKHDSVFDWKSLLNCWAYQELQNRSKQVWVIHGSQYLKKASGIRSHRSAVCLAHMSSYRLEDSNVLASDGTWANELCMRNLVDWRGISSTEARGQAVCMSRGVWIGDHGVGLQITHPTHFIVRNIYLYILC